MTIAWRQGRVDELGASWPGAQELRATITGDAAETGATVRALAYPRLVGAVRVGDRVLLGLGALARGLGTGGYATVIALPDRLPADAAPGPGHVVKARYTPMQTIVLGVDEQESPHHATMRDADDLRGVPVVVADLHSALPAIVAGAGLGRDRRERAHRAPDRHRIAYVMTDGGALPAWFSRAAATLRDEGYLAGVVTVGQAFGGDLEAVNVHTGLLAARHVLGADLVIVAQGPGNLGTGTRWGFSGTAAGEALNAAAVLGGRPVAALRLSGADERERHRGLSHHSVTAIGRVALAPVDVVVPVFDAGDELESALPGGPARFAALVEERLPATLAGRHTAVRISTRGLADALRSVPVRLSTMGRGLEADPASFLAAGAAGVHAARLAAQPPAPAPAQAPLPRDG